MSTDYDKGYKQGVLDALEIPFNFVGTYTGPWLRKKLDQHRENLLTKKVTKWTALYDEGGSGEYRTINISFEYEGKTRLFDSKEEAEEALKNFTKPIGAFPIEIEVKL